MIVGLMLASPIGAHNCLIIRDGRINRKGATTPGLILEECPRCSALDTAFGANASGNSSRTTLLISEVL